MMKNAITETGKQLAVLPSLDLAADRIHLLTGDHPVKVVFCEASVLESVEQSLSNKPSQPLLVATTDPRDDVTKTLTVSDKEFCLFRVTDVAKHIPVIYFTSGSTGDSKGVFIPDSALQRLGYSYEDELIGSYLLSSPFAWISCPISLVSSILKGYTLVLNNSTVPRNSLQLIEKYKVNGWLIPAQNLNYFIEEPSLLNTDLSSLTFVVVGADVMLRKGVERFVTKVLKGELGVQNIYGMTETGLLTTWRHSDLLDLSKANSSGYLAPGVQTKIMDEGGEAVLESLGEVWVKSLSLMTGYWDRPQLNKQVFDKDGFFRTGDAGYFDGDGHLHIIGRVSSLVNVGGKKISLAHLEDVLKSHPAVLEGVVVAKPHPEDSYHLTAFVVKKPKSNVSAEDIINFVEGEVEGEKLKGGVRFMDSIPKTANNKIQRKYFENMLM